MLPYPNRCCLFPCQVNQPYHRTLFQCFLSVLQISECYPVRKIYRHYQPCQSLLFQYLLDYPYLIFPHLFLYHWIYPLYLLYPWYLLYPAFLFYWIHCRFCLFHLLYQNLYSVFQYRPFLLYPVHLSGLNQDCLHSQRRFYHLL